MNSAVQIDVTFLPCWGCPTRSGYAIPHVCPYSYSHCSDQGEFDQLKVPWLPTGFRTDKLRKVGPRGNTLTRALGAMVESPGPRSLAGLT